MMVFKFKVESITLFETGASVRMIPCFSGTGKLEFEVMDKETAKQFQPGDEWMLNMNLSKKKEA